MNQSTQAAREEAVRYHLEHENNRTHIVDYFKEIIYGGIDGIVTTFAVVAGFSGAALSGEVTTQLTFMVVLLFGLANLFADGISMGLGNFLSVKSDKDLYNAVRGKEVDEVRLNPEAEHAETVAILIEKGFSEAEARTLADVYRTNEAYWVDFMMSHEHEIADARDEKPAVSGLTTFGSFVVFGSIPLLPFIFSIQSDPRTLFVYSACGTFFALVLLGALKWRVVGTPLFASLVEVVTVGGAAAIIAYFIGSFFEI